MYQSCFSDSPLNRGKTKGVGRDEKKALELLEGLVSKGVAKAEDWLGMRLVRGFGIQQDVNKGLKLIESAASKGLINAQLTLGGWFSGMDQLVEIDAKKAFKYFKLAADQGDPNAQFCIALLYSRGEGTPKDVRMAVENFRLAIPAVPQAQLRLTQFTNFLQEGAEKERQEQHLFSSGVKKGRNT